MTIRSIIPALLLAACWSGRAPAAVFQFVAPAPTAKGQHRAYLWIPPRAEQVRGVVLGGMTLMERECAQDPRIRRVCDDEGLAIVFLTCGLGATDIQQVLDRCAEVSGYRETSVAPLFFLGHSAGGPQARRRAHENAPRCFGLVQYRGGDPGDVDHAGAEAVGGDVPALMMIGQFDEFGKIGRDASGVENWEKDRDKLLAFRRASERHLASIAVEPGAGHFAWSQRSADYLALFLKKAAQARIPQGWPADAKQPIECLRPDPQSGWLTDATIKTPGKFPPAPVAQYSGNRENACWHFDRELAEASLAYHAGIERQDQFIAWNDPHTVNAGARNFFSRLLWRGDGQTFEVHPAYAASYPNLPGGQGARWGRAGEPVGHSSTPLQVRPVAGAIVSAGEQRFRIRHNELAPATDDSRIVFMAFSEGDRDYRYTERVGMFASCRLTTGKSQVITFKPLEKQSAAGLPVRLQATSDAGLPVEFHVGFGPAKVVAGQLELTELPKRASFPIQVQVVAWQFGSGVEPLVQTAAPVEQTISILEP